MDVPGGLNWTVQTIESVRSAKVDGPKEGHWILIRDKSRRSRTIEGLSYVGDGFW